jgi:ELWxxDGT repeat protein
MKIYFLLAAFIFCFATVRSQQLVKDINTVTGSLYKTSNITDFTVAGDKTYFVTDDETNGDEPWITDGIVAGTHLLRDINPGKISSAPIVFTYCNGYVYFRTDDGSHGYEL